MLRSKMNTEDKEHSSKWQSETNATFGYGEITRVSFKYIQSQLYVNLIQINCGLTERVRSTILGFFFFQLRVSVIYIFNLQGAFTNFLTHIQNASIFIKAVCRKEKVEISKLPFKPEECNFISMKSTFLDIGSGFGKPNFHCAL